MKELDTGKEKVKKICDVLRQETLEPAKKEASQIIEKAHAEAAKIISRAEAEAQRIHEEFKRENEKQRAAFRSSLEQSCRQTLELLRQEIENKLFNRELKSLLGAEMRKSEVIARLVASVIEGIRKEGSSVDLSVFIPSAVSVDEVNQLLTREILEKLREKSVLLSDIDGGVTVKLHDENMTLDITENALKEIVAGYIRKDFRKMLFT